MELGYPNSWAEGQTRALEAFQQDAPNAPAPVEEIPPHLPADRQCFCLAHFYQPLPTPIYLLLSYLLWLIQKWVQPGPTGLPRAMTWSFGCWAEMETYLGTATALQTTKTHKLLLKAPTSQRPPGSTSGNATRQVACTSWYEVGDPKAVGDLCAGSSSPGMLQGTIGTGTYPPLDSGALLTKLSFPQSLQNNTFYILMK